jgi:hypothetical protein
MFWTDAYEQQGIVYLMGKARVHLASHLSALPRCSAKDPTSQTFYPSLHAYVSCCVAVRNMQRNVFVLPRDKKLAPSGAVTDEDVGLVDVYEEVSAAMDAARIPKWASKGVVRRYAFELPGVPAEATYLKVVYPYAGTSLHMKTAPPPVAGGRRLGSRGARLQLPRCRPR